MRFFALAALALAACSAPTTTSSTDPIKYAMAPFTVPSGGELFRCQYFPPTGKDVYVTALHSKMSSGSHHLIVFRIDPTLGSVPSEMQEDCDASDMPNSVTSILFASQTPETTTELPDGVGFKLDGRHGIYFQSHYLNVTSAPIDATVEFDFKPVDKSKVTLAAGEFFLSNLSLDIPTGVSSQSQSCAAPFDMNMLNAQGHMHRHATAIAAKVGDNEIYRTDQWDSPVVKLYDKPGMPVKAGSVVRWTCDYDNKTGADLFYGNSAITNEMCIMAGLYYPAPEGLNDTWVCLSPTP